MNRYIQTPPPVPPVVYATTFEDGSTITPYTASAYIEVFCEGENASDIDIIRAWSYLVGTKIAYKLQGWYARTATHMISSGVLAENGRIIPDDIIEHSKAINNDTGN